MKSLFGDVSSGTMGGTSSDSLVFSWKRDRAVRVLLLSAHLFAYLLVGACGDSNATPGLDAASGLDASIDSDALPSPDAGTKQPIGGLIAMGSPVGALQGADISNHGLVDPLNAASELIYPTIKELGAPIAFQTVGPDVDFDAALALGFQYGMTEFEMWDTREAGGQADVSLAKLQEWAGLFSSSP